MTVDFKMTPDSNRVYDFSINAQGDFETEDSYDTAITYSVLGERRADVSEVQPASLRRGWIGNEFNDFENGSKVWLYYGERVTRDTLNGLQNEVLSSVDWLVDDGRAVNTAAEAVLRDGTIGVTVTIVRPSSEVEQRFIELWDNTGQ